MKVASSLCHRAVALRDQESAARNANARNFITDISGTSLSTAISISPTYPSRASAIRVIRHFLAHSASSRAFFATVSRPTQPILSSTFRPLASNHGSYVSAHRPLLLSHRSHAHRIAEKPRNSCDTFNLQLRATASSPTFSWCDS